MSCLCCTTVSQGSVAVIEKMGKFSRVEDPGFVCLCAPFEYITGFQSLRVQQLNVECETKTKDNVFVQIHISVQYQVIKEKIYAAYYMLQNPQQQLTAYVFDVIRASLPSMDLDQAFESKDDISRSLKHHLEEVMSSYGFMIMQALVTEMIPDQRVRNAMNEINASKRLKEAATQRAEGEKIVKVKKAEAEAESMYLSGVGVARQRKAIMDGFRDNLVEFTSSVEGSSSKDILDLLVLNQYFDTLNDVASNNGTKVVFLSNDSGSSGMRNGILQANASAGY
jgi:regulator of protease activity HflC (stomatin/prohibitin superfamily)